MQKKHHILIVLFFLGNLFVFPQGYEVFEKKYTVNVEINGQPLADVRWKEDSSLVTTGVFSTSLLKLSPLKRGYHFSPDIFNFNDFNRNETKIFRAYKYQLIDKLVYNFSFQKNTFQEVLNANNATAIDVGFKESERGDNIYFNGTSSYLDFGADVTNMHELTIAVWLKPEKVDGSNSIVGKGEEFSAKIFNGQLQFTTPGIKDHVGHGSVIEPNKWVHAAFVYIPNDQVFFYINGKVVDTVRASAISNTSHSILIGSNLWGQNYQGLMDNLLLWNRALSNEEIMGVYQNDFPDTGQSESGGVPVFWWIGLSIILMICLGWYYFYKRSAPKEAKSVKKAPTVVPLYHIQLLGGFKLLNMKGEGITHMLPPKRKELFLLLLLYSVKEGGISSKKLGEILWPGFSPTSIKNNRSTQIKEVRNLLGNSLPVEIVFEEKKWRIAFDDKVKIDIVHLQSKIPELFKNTGKLFLEEKELMCIARIVKRGAFLPQLDMEWLDSFKAKYGNSLLDVLTPYFESPASISNDLLIEVIDAVLEIDPLHELAVKLKIKIYVKEGKHMSAQKLKEHYKKLYEAFYKESFDLSILQ